MVEERSSGSWIIFITFAIAMLLTVISLPDFLPEQLGHSRPQWLSLVLVYWVIALPHRIGVTVAWLLGLLVDVMLGSLLGQHGIAFIVVAYIASSLYQRLRMFAVWQQSLIVFITIGLSDLINFWIESIVDEAAWSLWYLLPALVSALLWPWVFAVLRFIRRFFHVT